MSGQSACDWAWDETDFREPGPEWQVPIQHLPFLKPRSSFQNSARLLKPDLHNHCLTNEAWTKKSGEVLAHQTTPLKKPQGPSPCDCMDRSDRWRLARKFRRREITDSMLLQRKSNQAKRVRPPVWIGAPSGSLARRATSASSSSAMLLAAGEFSSTTGRSTRITSSPTSLKERLRR